MSEYGLGALPSPPDARDFDLSRLLEATAPLPVPRKYNATPVPPILDQDNTGRCGGFSLTRAVMWLQRTHPTVKRWLPLDPDAFYHLVKAHDGISAEGTTGRAAMDTALRYGVPVKGKGALRYHIQSYWRVPLDPAAMQQAVLRYGVITVGLPWYESWFHPKSNGQLPAPAGRASGHLIDCDGWDSPTRLQWRPPLLYLGGNSAPAGGRRSNRADALGSRLDDVRLWLGRVAGHRGHEPGPAAQTASPVAAEWRATTLAVASASRHRLARVLPVLERAAAVRR